MRILPVEGSVLSEFVIAGNGKDAEVRARTSCGRRFGFASSASHLEIAVHGSVLMEITGQTMPRS